MLIWLVAVQEPMAAVTVYVVADVGATVTDAPLPAPLLHEYDVALEELAVSVALLPSPQMVLLVTLEVTLLITGRGFTVI